jgi:serralysin
LRRQLLCAVAALVALAGAGTAQAGTLSFAPDDATYAAAPGETNHVFVFWDPSGLRAIDLGAPVTAGPGCVSVGPNEAFCANVPSGTDLLVTADDMNDYVNTGSASLPQRVEGGDGNDTLNSGFQFGAKLEGGPGADVFVTEGGTVDYSSRTNPLTITVGDDLANDGEAGENDLVPDGVSMIFAGDGADTISLDALGSGDGQVWVFGHAGNDVLTASIPLARLFGNSGEDQLEAPTSRSILEGGGGNDVLIGGDGFQNVHGGSGADLLRTGRGPDNLSGDTGDDEIIGGRGYDILRGNEGDDTLRARDGQHDLLRGQEDFDRARIDKGLDTVFSVEEFF